jgi:hypothetical protein
MTDYSRSNILLPHFEEAEAFLNALAGQDAPFTFQTFDDVKVWSEEKQKFINRQAPNLARIFHGKVLLKSDKQYCTRLTSDRICFCTARFALPTELDLPSLPKIPKFGIG